MAAFKGATELNCYAVLRMIQLILQPEVEAQVAAEAQARGMAVDRLIEQMVQMQLASKSEARGKSHSVGEAIDRILRLREVTPLGDAKIRDLINEGRRY